MDSRRCSHLSTMIAPASRVNMAWPSATSVLKSNVRLSRRRQSIVRNDDPDPTLNPAPTHLPNLNLHLTLTLLRNFSPRVWKYQTQDFATHAAPARTRLY